MSSAKIIALLCVIALGLIAIILYNEPPALPTQKKPASSMQSRAIDPQSRLTFDPQVLTLTTYNDQQLVVTVNTGKNELTSAQLEIKYDPEAISIKSIRSGGFFPDATPTLNDSLRRRGRIDFVLTLPTGHAPVRGSGKLALITLARNPLATGSAETKIELLPKTSLRGNDASFSLLQSTGSATIRFRPILSPPSSL